MRKRLFDKNERGAALVEMTIVSLLLICLAGAIFEYGNLFGTSIDVSAAARDAARTGAATTSSIVPDSTIVASMKDRKGLAQSQIKKIVIYRANGLDGKVPAECVSQYPPAAGLKCNAYRTEDLSSPDLSSTPGSQGWPPNSRVAGSDLIGVYVEVAYKPLVSLVWTPATFNDQAAMLIEPKSPFGSTDAFAGFTVGNAAPVTRNWDAIAEPNPACTAPCGAFNPGEQTGEDGSAH